MQGLVSFLNVQPTQAAPIASTLPILSPGDTVSAAGNKHILLTDYVTGDTQTLSPDGTNTTSPGDNEKDTALSHRPLLHSEIAPNNDTFSPGDDTVSAQHTELTSLVSVSDHNFSPRATGVAVRAQHLQVRSLTRAEDGHSANEQRTYLALWNTGNPVLGQLFRRNTIGHAGLAKMLKVDKRQTKRWIPTLIEKLTIEVETESSYATKTTYRVFERAEIHSRRLRAGYTSFIKNRGGVEILKSAYLSCGNCDSLSPGDTHIDSGGDNKTVKPSDNKQDSTLSPGNILSPGPGDTMPPEGGDTVSPPYKEVNSKKVFEEDSSSHLRAVIEQLGALGIDADDDFSRQLIRRSRAVCQDVTISEILHFTEAKAKYRGIQKSLTGFLLTAVPRCLTGESFRLYRQAEIARMAADRQSWIELRSEAEQILNSRQGREAWEIDNAESTLQWLRERQPWVFDQIQ